MQDQKVYHYHVDHLGTPQEISNEQGEIVWSVRYRAYGNVVKKEIEQIENNLRFQGQYFDEETGLHYNRFRYYNPTTGRFINQDPIGLLGGMNNYQYAPNPTGWVDPLGLACKQNAWNEFQKAHKGMFDSPAQASAAYQKLKKDESPWPIGYDYKSNIRLINEGDEFQMIVNCGCEDLPGMFGTFDDISSQEYGRQQLAIKEGWKSSLDNVVTYRAKKSFYVYEGPVGPQIDGRKYLGGGGTQITFVDRSVWANARPNEYNDFVDEPYLEIVDVKTLKDK